VLARFIASKKAKVMYSTSPVVCFEPFVGGSSRPFLYVMMGRVRGGIYGVGAERWQVFSLAV
jgi:hypothetical protein